MIGNEIADGFRVDPGLAQHLQELFGGQLATRGEFVDAGLHILGRGLNPGLAHGLPAQAIVDQGLAYLFFRGTGHTQQFQKLLALLQFVPGDDVLIDPDGRGEQALRARLWRGQGQHGGGGDRRKGPAGAEKFGKA